MPALARINHRCQAERTCASLTAICDGFAGKILFVAESAGRREGLIEKLRQYKITVKPVDSWQAFLQSELSPCIMVAPMDHGLLADQKILAIAIITESQLSGEKIQQRRRRRKSAARELENIVNNLNELTIGSPVVHQEHGVGRYLGLQTLQIGGMTRNFWPWNMPMTISCMCRFRRCT